MPERAERRVGRHLVWWLTAALLAGGPAAAAATDATTGTPTVVAGEVRFVAAGGDLLRLDGDRRYEGDLVARPSGWVVNDLTFEQYVEGVAEMPSRWPEEALRAQAVAARTYAWWVTERGSYADFDICATTACQVFRGAEVALDGGQAWIQAVRDTRGEVLVEQGGGPALTRYFSTSGGRTFDNATVFPSTGALPYLVAVDDPADAASPYHRWTVRFSRAEFDRILTRGERLSVVVPVADVRRLGGVDDPAAVVEAVGADGARVQVTAGELRDLISVVAPDEFPDRFPGPRADGLRRLPTTVPTARYALEFGAEEVVLEGRGWGHGVGMGQYGARERARGGASYLEILAAYYQGLRPVVDPSLPERITVGLARTDQFTVSSAGPFVIEGPDGVVVERALGAWTARHDGDAWQLEPPPATHEPLAVTPTRELEGLAGSEDEVLVEATVNKPVELWLEVRDAAGVQVLERPFGVAEAGAHRATWRLTDADGRAVAPGDYAVALVAADAQGDRAGQPVSVTVAPGAGGGSGLPSWVLAAAGALLLALVLLVVTRRRRTR